MKKNKIDKVIGQFVLAFFVIMNMLSFSVFLALWIIKSHIIWALFTSNSLFMTIISSYIYIKNAQ